MPTFKDAESPFTVVPEGDYVLAVCQFSQDYSSGPSTSGAKRFNIVFKIEGTDSKVKEQLIDHPKTDWKIDLFLKACGIRSLPKDSEFEFIKKDAEEKGVPWINPMGLRCPAFVAQETYTSQKSGREITKNVVGTYYTDKPVLPVDKELRQKSTSGLPF
jgi:hypothetical protein